MFCIFLHTRYIVLHFNYHLWPDKKDKWLFLCPTESPVFHQLIWDNFQRKLAKSLKPTVLFAFILWFSFSRSDRLSEYIRCLTQVLFKSYIFSHLRVGFLVSARFLDKRLTNVLTGIVEGGHNFCGRLIGFFPIFAFVITFIIRLYAREMFKKRM